VKKRVAERVDGHPGVGVLVGPRRCQHEGHVIKVIRKRLDRSLLWSVVALLGVVGAGYVYPPLASDPIYWLALIVFLLPIGTAIAIRTRRRAQAPAPMRSVPFKLSAVFLTGLALVVFLNGQMDRSAVTEIHTKVAGKFTGRGRFSTSYHPNVASWRRAGREEICASAGTFMTARIAVTISPSSFTEGRSTYPGTARSRCSVSAR
jgi:hypothetical protein